MRMAWGSALQEKLMLMFIFMRDWHAQGLCWGHARQESPVIQLHAGLLCARFCLGHALQESAATQLQAGLAV